ncbi:hypothetical protein [Sulfobacillus harzensis]|uniref:Uncharacterized protein n=1 Tax=Sulfobacillus harzensis TaxID=2729629 RepID=A0A7Y0Q1Q4_9FIRM|nr:hypothetical protein [Sulfobacillus harzensis]NMP21560.1 hypothetical protein [Sulfobacillus harzensis]
MSARHLGPRLPEPGACEDNAPLKAVMHACRQCHRSFPYHYDTYYEPAYLTEIDFICRDCLGRYLQRKEPLRTSM